ncbi:MAG: alpha/beta hydrolase [Desulfovibrionaceae bacterium]
MLLRSLVLTLLILTHIPFAALALMPIQTGTVDVGEAKLAYRIYGQGEPLLLITGYAVTMESWPEPLLKELSRDRSVIIFDNRGMALSTASDTPFSLPLMAEDAADLLQGLGIGHAAVLGWSMGGCIAQELALLHPEMVEKLVLYATDVDSDEVVKALASIQATPDARPLAHLFPAAWMNAHPDYLSLLPPVTVTPDPDMIARQKKAIEQWAGTRDRLQHINIPVLFIVGEQDTVTRAERSRLGISLVSGPAWLAVFDNAGHGLMFQAPMEMALTVLDFLAVKQQLN